MLRTSDQFLGTFLRAWHRQLTRSILLGATWWSLSHAHSQVNTFGFQSLLQHLLCALFSGTWSERKSPIRRNARYCSLSSPCHHPHLDGLLSSLWEIIKKDHQNKQKISSAECISVPYFPMNGMTIRLSV